jgi:DNA-binding MarR family transcriptional regulator
MAARVSNSPVLLLHRASKRVYRHMDAEFADPDFPYSQWLAVSLILENHARTASEVADCMGFFSRAATRLLDRLERDGLLTRSRDQKDRRIVHVRLTKAGIAAVERGRPVVAKRWGELFASYSRTERDVLIDILRGMALLAASTPPSSQPME